MQTDDLLSVPGLYFSTFVLSFEFYTYVCTYRSVKSEKCNDVFGPMSNGHQATPESTQDYGYDIASHAEREAP